MEKLLAHIPPSLRTGLLTWLLSRALFWATFALVAGIDLESYRAWATLAYDSPEGPPLWRFLVKGWQWSLPQLEFSHVLLNPWTATVLLGELALLLGATRVYALARKDKVQAPVAERATWLWTFSPLMAWTLWDSSWAIGAGLGAFALGAAWEGRHKSAALAAALALGVRPEFILAWPALGAFGWIAHQPKSHAPWTRWLLLIAPPVAFTAWVLTAMQLAGQDGISLRTLQPLMPLRESLVWRGAMHHAPELVVFLGCLLAVVLGLRFVKVAPRSWWLLVLPCLAFPWLYAQAAPMAPVLLFALPAFAWLGRAAEEPLVHRTLVGASFAGAALLMAYGQGLGGGA